MGKKVAYSDLAGGILTIFHLSDADAKKVNDLFSDGEMDPAWDYAEKHATKIQRIRDVTGFWDDQ